MGLEQNLWRWLKKETREAVKNRELHMCRIENGVGVGYPDVEANYRGFAFHLELKAIERPKRSTTKLRVKFQPGQIPWITRRIDAGGVCGVLLGVGTGRQRKIYFIDGADVKDLQGKYTEMELQECGPEVRNWDDLITYLAYPPILGAEKECNIEPF